jgi:hypothetical protein
MVGVTRFWRRTRQMMIGASVEEWTRLSEEARRYVAAQSR